MIFTLILGFICYILLGSLVPFLKRVDVSEQTKKETEAKRFTSNTTGPDRASVIIDSADALNVRLEAVRHASEAVDIVMYKIIDSDSTRAFFGEVYEAAERGVKVNILVNGVTYLFYQNHRKLKALNAHPNITCRLYHPVNLWKPWRLHFMMHDKMIVVDDRYLLTGGRNVDERHFRPVGYNKPMAYDLEIFVVNTKKQKAGPSVLEDVRTYVDSLYAYEGTAVIAEKADPAVIQLFQDTRAAYLHSNPQFYDKTLEDFIGETVPTNKITLMTNPIHLGKKEPVLGYQLLYLASHAKEALNIQTPYITWDKRIYKALKQLAQQIRVTIQTNSAISTPNFFGFSNYYHNRQKYLETGVEIYEFQSLDSVHNKSFILDDRMSIIGTYNMDARSLSINTEVMLAVDGKAFTDYFLRDVEKFKAQSLKVGTDNQYLASKTVKEIPVPIFKKVILFLFYVLLRPIQFLL